eukprot:COSAG01_NODE_12330_length_1757_cov_40.011460_1_plen_89_part_10
MPVAAVPPPLPRSSTGRLGSCPTGIAVRSVRPVPHSELSRYGDCAGVDKLQHKVDEVAGEDHAGTTGIRTPPDLVSLVLPERVLLTAAA